MAQSEDQIKTDIAEEEAAAAPKRAKRIWLFVGLGACLLAVALAVLIVAVRKPQEESPPLTAEELEQLKYDSEQLEREKQKTDQIRDQTFLIRKGDDNEAQLNSLLKELDIERDTGLQARFSDEQAKAEEEAIAHVLRSSAPRRTQSESPRQMQPKAIQRAEQSAATEISMSPMFVYSRNFGGAKYVDTPQKQSVQQPQMEPSEFAATSSPIAVTSDADNPKSLEILDEQALEEMVHLIYTDYPPVTLYEGEMLEAVLVNRIIADTEPSPVVCQISKDVFDYSAQYVVIPASSRVIGLSQVVTYKGAHRLFISFHRIILPNGPSIDLPSSSKALKALDQTGALGVVSKVERHWFLQFGTAIFFGVLDGISGAAQRNRDVFSTRSVILGRTSENFDRLLENIMSQYSTIVPTIRVDQGKKMKIYLSDDIMISPYAKISDRSYYANR